MWYAADKRSIGLHGTFLPASRTKGEICLTNSFASGPVGLLATTAARARHPGWLSISTTFSDDS